MSPTCSAAKHWRNVYWDRETSNVECHSVQFDFAFRVPHWAKVTLIEPCAAYNVGECKAHIELESNRPED